MIEGSKLNKTKMLKESRDSDYITKYNTSIKAGDYFYLENSWDGNPFWGVIVNVETDRDGYTEYLTRVDAIVAYVDPDEEEEFGIDTICLGDKFFKHGKERYLISPREEYGFQGEMCDALEAAYNRSN